MCFSLVLFFGCVGGIIHLLNSRPSGLDYMEETEVKKVDHHQDAPKKTGTYWNAMKVGFISPEAVIETGATVEPGAFIFPKAVIRSGAVGKFPVFPTTVQW